jgi:hypothetical protein
VIANAGRAPFVFVSALGLVVGPVGLEPTTKRL